jgi:hypothetical protein
MALTFNIFWTFKSFDSLSSSSCVRSLLGIGWLWLAVLNKHTRLTRIALIVQAICVVNWSGLGSGGHFPILRACLEKHISFHDKSSRSRELQFHCDIERGYIHTRARTYVNTHILFLRLSLSEFWPPTMKTYLCTRGAERPLTYLLPPPLLYQ